MGKSQHVEGQEPLQGKEQESLQGIEQESLQGRGLKPLQGGEQGLRKVLHEREQSETALSYRSF